MVHAPVGWQCPDCTAAGARRSHQVPAFTRTSPNRTGVVGSTNPTPVVLVIVAVNVVVFVLERFGNNVSFVDRYAMQPDRIHHEGQYYRAVTSMFLHANFLHILFNMIALLIVGPAVEVLLGKARFVALYLIAGLGGSVGSYLLGPHSEYGIGASGAIMGIMGAYVVIGLRRHLPVAPVVGLLVLNFGIGFSGDIDWRAHLGGLVTGCVLAWLYDYAGGLRDRGQEVALTVGGSAVTVGVLALLITSVSPGLVNWA
jgi:membrane associated rhomboid family serine protease